MMAMMTTRMANALKQIIHSMNRGKTMVVVVFGKLQKNLIKRWNFHKYAVHVHDEKTVSIF